MDFLKLKITRLSQSKIIKIQLSKQRACYFDIAT